MRQAVVGGVVVGMANGGDGLVDMPDKGREFRGWYKRLLDLRAIGEAKGIGDLMVAVVVSRHGGFWYYRWANSQRRCAPDFRYG